jgi:hypothetical protein
METIIFKIFNKRLLTHLYEDEIDEMTSFVDIVGNLEATAKNDLSSWNYQSWILFL